MGCNCHNSIRQEKDVMRKKAIEFAVHMEVDVQFHTWTQRGFSRLYDYEEKGSVERGSGVIEIIKFRNYKSKNVLSDSKKPEPDSKESGKSTKRKSRGTGKGDKKAKRKLGKGDESSGASKSRSSEK